MQTNKIFSYYKNCTFCNNKKLLKKKRGVIKENFYTKAIINDLSISKKTIGKPDVYECQKCFLVQLNPWFNKNIARKIYSNIYGQHNKSWSNYISFVNYCKLPNHGNLYKLLKQNIKIKKYAEYNSPFMGLFFDFFLDELKNKKICKIYSKKLIEYLSSRQLAGKSKKFKQHAEEKASKLIKQINLIKKKFLRLKNKKFLYLDNSEICWGQNDNYKSVNSRSLASEFFDLNIVDIKNNDDINLDLFGIFLTLDHTFEPKKILDFALKKSKYVIIQCHINNEVTRQHQFSFTKKFLKFLSSVNIHSLDISEFLNKKIFLNEMYFICSKNKNLMEKLRYRFLKNT